MEWKINRERIPVTERILDETQEQGVELDYVLPDYDPEIFRIIRCEMQPAILEYQLQETRLSYELQVDLRILYCGSDRFPLLPKINPGVMNTRALCNTFSVSSSTSAQLSGISAASKGRLCELSGSQPQTAGCAGSGFCSGSNYRRTDAGSHLRCIRYASTVPEADDCLRQPETACC